MVFYNRDPRVVRMMSQMSTVLELAEERRRRQQQPALAESLAEASQTVSEPGDLTILNMASVMSEITSRPSSVQTDSRSSQHDRIVKALTMALTARHDGCRSSDLPFAVIELVGRSNLAVESSCRLLGGLLARYLLDGDGVTPRQLNYGGAPVAHMDGQYLQNSLSTLEVLGAQFGPNHSKTCKGLLENLAVGARGLSVVTVVGLALTHHTVRYMFVNIATGTPVHFGDGAEADFRNTVFILSGCYPTLTNHLHNYMECGVVTIELDDPLNGDQCRTILKDVEVKA